MRNVRASPASLFSLQHSLENCPAAFWTLSGILCISAQARFNCRTQNTSMAKHSSCNQKLHYVYWMLFALCSRCNKFPKSLPGLLGYSCVDCFAFPQWWQSCTLWKKSIAGCMALPYTCLEYTPSAISLWSGLIWQ